MADSTPVEERFLYGSPSAEHLHWDVAAWYESEIEPYLDDADGVLTFWDRPVEKLPIEKHSVYPPTEHLPLQESVLEYISEWSADQGMVDEGWSVQFDEVIQSPDTKRAMELLYRTIARQMKYGMAKDVVGTHELTWDDEGEPLVDGERMYVPRERKKFLLSDTWEIPGDGYYLIHGRRWRMVGPRAFEVDEYGDALYQKSGVDPEASHT